jgi:septum formation protein
MITPTLLLASQSPRRRQLLEAAGYAFTVEAADVDETAPEGMDVEHVAEFLARKKADATPLTHGLVILAADTIVLLDGEILGKPENADGARAMLRRLAGRTHKVATGVCIRSIDRVDAFTVLTEVTFRELTDAQIDYYVRTQPPLDKSGSYAIHEWIGMIAIERIAGDYYSVMGLPIGDVARRLEQDLASVFFSAPLPALQAGRLFQSPRPRPFRHSERRRIPCSRMPVQWDSWLYRMP